MKTIEGRKKMPGATSGTGAETTRGRKKTSGEATRRRTKTSGETIRTKTGGRRKKTGRRNTTKGRC